MDIHVERALTQAGHAAHAAAKEAHDRFGGDQWPCGFAWVEVAGVRSNSKLGKALIEGGFRKSCAKRGTLMLWNPSRFPAQSMDILEAGAAAYARVLRTELSLDAAAMSRMD